MTDKTSAADRRVDMMIRLALLDIAEEKWKQIEALDVSDVTLSERHIKRMRKLLTKGAPAIRRKRIAKRMLLVALVALSVVAMLGMAIRPVRQAFSNAVVTWYKEFFKVEITGEDREGYPVVIEELKEPQLLVDWKSEIIKDTDTGKTIRYTDQEGNSILFRQLIQQDYDQTLDNHYLIQDVKINGHPGILYTSQKWTNRIIQWADDSYLFQLEGNISYEFILQIAESVDYYGY